MLPGRTNLGLLLLLLQLFNQAFAVSHLYACHCFCLPSFDALSAFSFILTFRVLSSFKLVLRTDYQILFNFNHTRNNQSMNLIYLASLLWYLLLRILFRFFRLYPRMHPGLDNKSVSIDLTCGYPKSFDRLVAT